MTIRFYPGPKALAAAASLAGFSHEGTMGNLTDCTGKTYHNVSPLCVSLAVCQSESAGMAFATHKDSPQQTDLGAWQISSANKMFSDDPITGPHWWDFADSAAAAFKLYTEAGNSFKPWSSYNVTDKLTGVPRYLAWRDQTVKQSRLAWAHGAVAALDAAIKGGAALQQLVTINLEPVM